MNKRTELPTAENSSNFNRVAGATCQVGTTLENLKAAVCGETGASAKYAACAKLAKEKGYEQLGRLWEATSAAEQVHIRLEAGLVEELEPGYERPTADAPELEEIDLNLIASANGEIFETSDMYPGFIAKAQEEGNDKAVQVFTKAKLAYTPDGTDIYEPSDNNTRTLDENYNVVRVGDEMERVFTELGLTVVHDRTLYDYPKYNGAYDRSAEAVQRYLEQYPSIKIVLDVHRDALVGEDGTVYKAVTRIDGVDTAQVMLVLGSSEGGEHPNWMQNLSLACRIQESMNTLYPTLARPMTMRSSRYNQQLSNGSLLVEVGTHGNTLQEALAGARLFARAAGQVLLGLKE